MASMGRTDERPSYRIGFEPKRPEPATGGRGDPSIEMQAAFWPTRIGYALILLIAVIPFGYSGWVSLARGGLPAAGAALLPFIVFALYRAYLVLARPGTLDAPRVEGSLVWLRRIGLTLMAVGVVMSAARFAVVPIGRALFPRGSDNGIEFFVVGLAVAVLGSIAPLGLGLFEYSRLRSFEVWLSRQQV
jgi:hypothetical protein